MPSRVNKRKKKASPSKLNYQRERARKHRQAKKGKKDMRDIVYQTLEEMKDIVCQRIAQGMPDSAAERVPDLSFTAPETEELVSQADSLGSLFGEDEEISVEDSIDLDFELGGKVEIPSRDRMIEVEEEEDESVSSGEQYFMEAYDFHLEYIKALEIHKDVLDKIVKVFPKTLNQRNGKLVWKQINTSLLNLFKWKSMSAEDSHIAKECVKEVEGTVLEGVCNRDKKHFKGEIHSRYFLARLEGYDRQGPRRDFLSSDYIHPRSCYIAFVPLTKDGLYIEVWDEPDDIYSRSYGKILFIKYGYILVCKGDTVYSSGYMLKAGRDYKHLVIHFTNHVLPTNVLQYLFDDTRDEHYSTIYERSPFLRNFQVS